MTKNEKINYLNAMLGWMAEYSKLIPAQVDKISKEIMLSSAYFNYVTTMVESFFTIVSISVLLNEGLLSNSFALTRILIEQVSTVCVLTKNDKAMSYYLKIKGLRDSYYNNEITIKELNDIFKVNLDKRNIDRFFDYGWSLSFGSTGWGSEKIVKEAKFEELLNDKWYLNLFAHGQLSWFQLKKAGDNEYVDEFLIRIITIVGTLFFHLRVSLLNFFGENIENSELYGLFKNAKFCFEKATKILKSIHK